MVFGPGIENVIVHRSPKMQLGIETGDAAVVALGMDGLDTPNLLRLTGVEISILPMFGHGTGGLVEPLPIG